ncbi:MAG: ABC transporter permease [Candidatus Bathyarchaeota archaeon]|jgi:simple sugar transport system permease protein|nr:ABC transporter permease [Candidatus Bathyarchaeota archaeon]
MNEKSKKFDINILELASRIFEKLKLEFKTILPQLIAISIALLVGALVLLVSGFSPIEAYGSLLAGAFGDIYGLGQTLTQTTPIVFTALAFLFAFKAGLFNIGAEGQFLVGAFAAAIVGISFNGLPSIIHIPLALLVGAVVGGLWALIPALLKTELGAHEVITTMMLTYVAIYVTGYLANDVFRAEGWVAQTPLITTSAELPRILPPTQLSASLFLGIILVGLTSYVLQKTILGYEVRAIGLNPLAAENAGINVKRGLIIALVISGALAGLGGAGEVLGVHRRFIDGFSPGYGWDGLAVALIGGLNPIGALLAALLFGILRSGGMTMNRVTGVPIDIVTILQGLVILFVAAPVIIKYLRKRRAKND